MKEMEQFHPEEKCCSYLDGIYGHAVVQKHPALIDNHAVEEGPEIVSTAPDLEELTVN